MVQTPHRPNPRCWPRAPSTLRLARPGRPLRWPQPQGDLLWQTGCCLPGLPCITLPRAGRATLSQGL